MLGCIPIRNHDSVNVLISATCTKYTVLESFKKIVGV